MDAYEQNGHPRLTIKQWEAALDPTWPLLKIAESSYAEVYKVTNPSGTSILKIMALKPPSGPGSRRETACTVESVLSEVLIMDLMAEVPGFLIFRDAHLIEGRPPETMVAAWEGYDWGCALLDGEEPADGDEAEGRSEFPHPAKYGKDQVFLSLELGDAGMDIEHYPIRTAAELWDIFLGITLALAMGEVVCGFEHRDLHEGNVCVKKLRPAVPCSPAQTHKFGYSGLEVTLLDYTLSRARNTRTGEILAFNLEENQELFYESEMLQRQMYRRMKSWVFFRAHGLTHELLDDEATSYELEHLWKEFHPYTNVIWTYYALEFSIMSFKGEREELEAFKRETEELRERIHPDKRLFDGGFASAAEVRAYCVEKGWLRAEDSNDMLEEDTSIIEKSKS
jgi:serine/threonine-protein kinase haspin